MIYTLRHPVDRTDVRYIDARDERELRSRLLPWARTINRDLRLFSGRAANGQVGTLGPYTITKEIT